MQRVFDDLISSLAQRRGFREYLAGCWRPGPEQTLTALAGAEPVTGAGHPGVTSLPARCET